MCHDLLQLLESATAGHPVGNALSLNLEPSVSEASLRNYLSQNHAFTIEFSLPQLHAIASLESSINIV